MKILNLITLGFFLSISAYAQDQVQVVEVPPTSDDENKIFNKVEVAPSFPGGKQAWEKFLTKNLDVNTPVKKGAPTGKYTVKVQFIVSKDGSVSEVTATTNQGYDMEEACIKAIKKSGKWISATQNGRKVNAYRVQPFIFTIKEK